MPPCHPRSLLGLLLAAASARAADPTPARGPNAIPLPQSPLTDLAPMVVTATGHPESPASLPFSTSTLDADDFARLLPRSTPEALRELPSVMLQRTGPAQTSPYLRGFTGFRTVLLVDGVRLNNSTFRDGPNQYWGTVDSLSLDRLEVVRGPSSVLYGSDAIGGTVHAISRSRQTFGPKSDADGHALYRYATADNSHASRAEFTANLGQKIGLAGGLSWKDFDDLRAGDGTGLQPHTGYSAWAGDAKIQYLVSPSTRLVFGHQTDDQDDAWRTHSTRHAKPWEGTVRGTDESRVYDQFRNLDYLRLEASNPDSFIDFFSWTVSYQIQNEDEDRLRSDRRREIQGTYVDTLGTTLQLQTPTAIGRWTAGTEFYHDWVDSRYTRYAADGTVQLRRLQGPVGDDSQYDLFGVYLQDHLPLLGERLELIAGGRYNFASAHVGQAVNPLTNDTLGFDDSWNTAVGSGRLIVHLDADHRWSVFGGASQGFRAPNLSDLSRFDLADRGEIEVPVFDLAPEHYLALEGGIRANAGRWSAEASYHHTDIEDMIVRYLDGRTAPTGEAIVLKKNSGQGEIRGVEVTATYHWTEEWSLWGNYTWMEGTLETPTGPTGPLTIEPVSRLMPTTFNVGLRYERSDRKFWAEFASTIAARQDRLSSADRRDTQRIPPNGTPGYELFHLRAGWKPTDRFTLSAALENLTDANYRIHGSGINEAGLNLVVSADMRF